MFLRIVNPLWITLRWVGNWFKRGKVVDGWSRVIRHAFCCPKCWTVSYDTRTTNFDRLLSTDSPTRLLFTLFLSNAIQWFEGTLMFVISSIENSAFGTDSTRNFHFDQWISNCSSTILLTGMTVFLVPTLSIFQMQSSKIEILVDFIK